MPFRLPRHARLLRFPSADGLRLEGRLTPGAQNRAVVLCHPHPHYGGSMLTPVILTAEQALHEAGYTTLAFNFRGVGGSEGTHGEGRAELADVTGALAFLAETLGGPLSIQAVAGYSFGSVVGGQVAAADARVTWYLGIAPPLSLSDFAFLRQARCRLAFIAGRHDEFSSPARLEALCASLPARPWRELLDTDHFFGDALDALAAACRAAITWAENGRSAAG
ncbi:MAG: alpha/beta hydrolase [Candidatus Rokubacteria bacterium]|nr:alpha/beta hydrolase [Candidatus Rokubacteria bacterium]